jgi:hypothetical protein
VELVIIVHVVAAAVLVGAAFAVGIWGLVRARTIAASTSGGREPAFFAQALQLTHTLVLGVGLAGVAMLIAGRAPSDELHVRVYGPFMLVAIVAAYGFRTSDHAANVRVFAVTSLVIGALGLRAMWTGA